MVFNTAEEAAERKAIVNIYHPHSKSVVLINPSVCHACFYCNFLAALLGLHTAKDELRIFASAPGNKTTVRL